MKRSIIRCLLLLMIASANMPGFAWNDPMADDAGMTNLPPEKRTVKLASDGSSEPVTQFEAEVKKLAAQVDKDGFQTDLLRAVRSTHRLQTQRPTADSPVEARRLYYGAMAGAINVVAGHAFTDLKGRYYEAQTLMIEELSAAHDLPLSDDPGHRLDIVQGAIPLSEFHSLLSAGFALWPHEAMVNDQILYIPDVRLSQEQWLARRRDLATICLAVGGALRASINFSFDINDRRNIPVIDNRYTFFETWQEKQDFDAKMRPVWAEEHRKQRYFTDQYVARQLLKDWESFASKFLEVYNYAPQNTVEIEYLMDVYGLRNTPEGGRILAKVKSEAPKFKVAK